MDPTWRIQDITTMQVTQLISGENCARALRFLRKNGRSPKPEGDTTSWKTSLFYYFQYFSSTHHYNLVNWQEQIEVIHKAFVTAH